MAKTLMEQLKENSALQITTTIESMLKQKTVAAIEETRKQVSAETFGMSFETPDKIQEDAQIDAAYNGKDQLDERDSTPDTHMAKHLADQALHNHNEYHSGNHDARHGGWAQHDLHTWAKNYARKKAKGTYDKELAVKGLTHAVRNSEASAFGRAHGTKHGQHVSGATRTAAARHLLPHVEKMMDQHVPQPKGKKKVTEAAAAAAIPMDRYQSAARARGASGQADFNKKWHAAKGDEAKRKELRKYAFHHDHDIPSDDHGQSHSKSAIHSFGEHVISEEVKMIPYPAKSKHLKDYKPASDSADEMHLNHPGGHSLTWHKKDNTFTHTAANGKEKKGKMVDLHQHLSKVHHDFDGKVQQHMKDHLHDQGSGLLHKMGKLSYAHHAHPEGRDQEEDAINHKAMRSAYLKLTKRDRGVK
jgi:hypothetical protein